MNYETRQYVSLDTQNRRTQSANVPILVLVCRWTTAYEILCDETRHYVHLNTQNITLPPQRIEIEKLRTHTRISERTHTATNDEDCQNKSSIHYNKIQDMKASERTRLSNLTTHLLNLKMLLLRVTQEHQWEKAMLRVCLTENSVYPLCVPRFFPQPVIHSELLEHYITQQ